jgi:hypothetical protein
MPADEQELVGRFDMATWVAESRARQALPPTIQDDEALEKVALLVAIPSTQPQGAQASEQTASPDRETSTRSR